MFKPDYQTLLVVEGFARRVSPIVVSAMGHWWIVQIQGGLRVQNPETGVWYGFSGRSWDTYSGEFSFLPPWDFSEDREKALRERVYGWNKEPSEDYNRWREWQALQFA